MTLTTFRQRRLPASRAIAYVALQIAGCRAGAILANVMFELPAIQLSTQVRTGGALWLSEFVATAGRAAGALDGALLLRVFAEPRVPA